MKPFSKRQLKAVDLRAEGHSYEKIAQMLDITDRTIWNWRQSPEWDRLLKQRQHSWVEEYENIFNRLMPKAAQRHTELLDSQSEAIKMRAVDSAHSNYSRNIKDQAVQTEVEELKAMVLMLTAELKQQRAG